MSGVLVTVKGSVGVSYGRDGCVFYLTTEDGARIAVIARPEVFPRWIQHWDYSTENLQVECEGTLYADDDMPLLEATVVRPIGATAEAHVA